MSHLTKLQTYLTKAQNDGYAAHRWQCFVRDNNTLILADNNTLILADKYLFSNDSYKIIESKFPNVRIDVVSSAGSRRTCEFPCFSYENSFNVGRMREVTVHNSQHAIPGIACTRHLFSLALARGR